jgi:hypothetical protein
MEVEVIKTYEEDIQFSIGSTLGFGQSEVEVRHEE